MISHGIEELVPTIALAVANRGAGLEPVELLLVPHRVGRLCSAFVNGDLARGLGTARGSVHAGTG